MARNPSPAAGAREAAPASENPNPNTAPVNESDNSGAAPEQAVIQPEPFNPNFDNVGPNSTGGATAPGLNGEDSDEDRIELETTGAFMIQDPYTLDVVPAEGTAKVRKTSFIDTAIADGRLREPGKK